MRVLFSKLSASAPVVDRGRHRLDQQERSMRKASFLPIVLAIALIVPMEQISAQTNSESYVSSTGSDSNQCYQSAPCVSISRALAQTTAGGEITLLDNLPYEEDPFINKAITIRAKAGQVELFGGYIYIAAGATDKVHIIGLTMFGGGHSGVGTNTGVYIQSASDVILENCRISGYFQIFSQSDSAAILMTNTSTPVRLTINNSNIIDNLNAIVVKSGPSMGHVKILNSVITSNTATGVQVAGAGNDVLFSNVQMLGNGKAINLLSGAKAISYGNNVITNGDAPVRMPLN
jgi:hypothetical protein